MKMNKIWLSVVSIISAIAVVLGYEFVSDPIILTATDYS